MVNHDVAVLTESEAESWLTRTCFTIGPAGRLGLELELLVGDREAGNLRRHHSPEEYARLLQRLSDAGLDGQVTLEPGGQVELSSNVGQSLAETVPIVHRDVALLRDRAASMGMMLCGLGLDPMRVPRRLTQQNRYTTMAGYLARWGEAAEAMMCSTASIQVNVEAATSQQTAEERWDLLHAVGPALVAAFANSPTFRGRPTGWKSARQRAWQRLDPARTGAPIRRQGEGVASTYARWALDAPLMLVRRDTGSWSVPPGVTFRDWLRLGRRAGIGSEEPTLDDLACHMTTLFPHVRARGHLEARFIDALPGCWWIVPTAVIAALLETPSVADRAREVCEATEGRWVLAARVGLENRELQRSAEAILAIAAGQLRGHPSNAVFADHVEAFLDRWTLRGRSPADDVRVSSGGSRDRCGLDS
ncbi:hypothetical protein ASC61_10740 [Aeromicrobium sp. Root344]|uniref:glutamate-cysteine ligase family protein n=1 Tax=Aeromicrobium sp. Root344 TaxID=1736521 RepID=UPI0006FF1241|nr:glutamate-cysteine ligase family protein [Aeromicrobium sp. Root344]KQV75441.1 hypothetical protein ASC61_10740 [Aeromicrobium sp. Root344]